jgi:hypothetical protein
MAFDPQWGGRWSPEPRQPDGSRFPSMGFLAAAWIQQRTGLELDGWQVELLRRGMLYDPGSLDWVVRDVIVVGPEGIGKSSFWARVGLWFLDGPCLPPEDSPRPYADPDIPVVSASLSLTEHIHRYARQAVAEGPLSGRLTVENTRVYRTDDADHRMAFPAASGAYQQGKNPRPVILEEELHVLNAPGVRQDGEETIEVVGSKRSKTPHPKVQRWTITNPDDGDPESLLGRRWQHAERVLAGETVDDELLAVHYHADDPWDLDDPEDLRRGIREATPLSVADVEAIAAKYERDRQSPSRFRRFSGGQFRAGEDHVLPEGALERLERSDREWPGADEPVALAFDGARNRDSIALRGCTTDGWSFEVGHWERPANVAVEDYRHPRAEIDDAVREALDLWPHGMLAVDDTYFEDLADDWEADFPDRVVRDYKREGPAAWELYRGLVVSALSDVDDGVEPRFTHDGSATLMRHARNAREHRHPQSAKVKLVKRRDDGTHPIDALVADAYARRLAQHLVPSEGVDDWRAALGLAAADG